MLFPMSTRRRGPSLITGDVPSRCACSCRLRVCLGASPLGWVVALPCIGRLPGCCLRAMALKPWACACALRTHHGALTAACRGRAPRCHECVRAVHVFHRPPWLSTRALILVFVFSSLGFRNLCAYLEPGLVWSARVLADSARAHCWLHARYHAFSGGCVCVLLFLNRLWMCMLMFPVLSPSNSTSGPAAARGLGLPFDLVLSNIRHAGPGEQCGPPC